MNTNKWDQWMSMMEGVIETLSQVPSEHRDSPDYWQAWSLVFVVLAKLEDALKAEDVARTRAVNRANAKLPRPKRGKSPENLLRTRALLRIINDIPEITASQLIDRISADSHLTFDDVDIALTIHGDHIRIRDLSPNPEIPETTIRRSSLRKYLSDARNT